MLPENRPPPIPYWHGRLPLPASECTPLCPPIRAEISNVLGDRGARLWSALIEDNSKSIIFAPPLYDYYRKPLPKYTPSYVDVYTRAVWREIKSLANRKSDVEGKPPRLLKVPRPIGITKMERKVKIHDLPAKASRGRTKKSASITAIASDNAKLLTFLREWSTS
ncbi:hypothetical protein GOP47_0016913 [Adiantum capillus-veneris]|uniref:Uncharacterized protein n=1 Tax=Adiantum capillus-veneris TaxID=13818 RepID=A0A9D4UJH4_ADICA|nr:hypothetical protein GOP47_0016913 [Adiantum capillus-veneris]